MMPKVALVGRTNVGKSTLFNRLIEQRQALTSPEPGTTRDRNFGICQWQGKEFIIIDTGGLDLGYLVKSKIPKKLKLTKVGTSLGLSADPQNLIEQSIVRQAELGIKEADFIIMVVDGQAGLQQEDQTIINIIRKSRKPFLIAVNKIDRKSQRHDIWQFSNLGGDNPIPVSALTGIGSGDLLDVLIKKLKFPGGRKSVKAEPLTISIIGKPNVGKSSLLNSILGEDRVITSPIPHTTREAHDVEFVYANRLFKIVDTAGIRRRAHVAKGLEKAGVNSSLYALKQSDIVILLVDISEDLTSQDAQLAQEIVNAKCGLIIAGNKWDSVPDKDTTTQHKFIEYFKDNFPALSWAPVIFVSAKTGQRVKKILDLAIAIEKEQNKKISDGQLDLLLNKAIKKHLPAQSKGNAHPYIYSLRQLGTKPPFFQLLIHPKAEIHFSYLRFLENQIRANWGFVGTPIEVHQKFYKK